MNRKAYTILVCSIVFLAVVWIAADTVKVCRQNSKLAQISESIENKQKNLQREIEKKKQQRNHLDKDRRAGEQLLRKRFMMIRPDQFILKNDIDSH
ncbi:hypothetical protein IKR20_04655 [bacterium]|nr:hypothetical protein [bacterium]